MIDRYIARQYLVNILALFVILFAFVVTIDVSLNLDRFWKIAGLRGVIEGPGGEQVMPDTFRRFLITSILIFDLWWPRLLQLFNLMLGLVLVGAMGFSCAQLVRHREMLAIVAGGQSLYRVMRPMLVVAIGMLTLQALNQELVLPHVAAKLTRGHSEAGRQSLVSQSVPVTPDARGRLWYARSYNPDSEALEGVYVWERDAEARAERRIFAETAEWTPAQGETPGAWVLSDPVVRGKTASAPPPEIRLETDLDPTALKVRRYSGYRQNLSWLQLSRLIEQSSEGRPDPGLVDRLQRTQFGRVSLMVSNMLALTMSLPFFLTSLPRNMFKQSLRAAPLAIAALLGGTLGASAQIPGLPPVLSVFVPVIVLLPLTVASIGSVRT